MIFGGVSFGAVTSWLSLSPGAAMLGTPPGVNGVWGTVTGLAWNVIRNALLATWRSRGRCAGGLGVRRNRKCRQEKQNERLHLDAELGMPESYPVR